MRILQRNKITTHLIRGIWDLGQVNVTGKDIVITAVKDESSNSGNLK